MKKKQLNDTAAANKILRRFNNKYLKQARERHTNLRRLIDHRTEDHVLELTLTFPKSSQPISPQELGKRFNSFATNHLDRKTYRGKKMFPEWIRFIEPHSNDSKKTRYTKTLPRKSLHVHVILGVSPSVNHPMREFEDYDDFDAAYTPPQWLTDWIEELKKVLPRYGFGLQYSVNPIKSNRRSFGKYFVKTIRKYAGKNGRPKYLKRVHLVTYGGGFKNNITSKLCYPF